MGPIGNSSADRFAAACWTPENWTSSGDANWPTPTVAAADGLIDAIAGELTAAHNDKPTIAAADKARLVVSLPLAGDELLLPQLGCCFASCVSSSDDNMVEAAAAKF